MDFLLFIYDFYPSWLIKLLCLAVVGQMALTIYVYAMTSNARMAAGKAGRIKADDYKTLANEPDDLRVYTNAIANQFELPVVFFALVIMSLVVGTASWLTVILAWAFVVFRVLHINEMLGTNTVMKRRKLFLISIIIFAVMLAEFVIALLFSRLV